MKKTTILCLFAVLALSVVGFCFALWSDQVSAGVTVQSGTLKFGFVNNSISQKDVGPDWAIDPGMENIEPAPEGKDVGSTLVSLSDADGDGYYELLNITVNNAYPYYYNEITAQIRNFGSIPFIVQYPVVHWMGESMSLDEGTVYWLGRDGQIIELPEEMPVLKVGDNWVMAICWMNNSGVQLHPGPKRLEESFDLTILQPAEQNTTYTLSISLDAIQWNESPIPATKTVK
jgi:hypothetical protein